MPQWFRRFGAPFENTVAQGHGGVASLIELTQQPLRLVDARLEAGEIESRHLIPPPEARATLFSPAQQAPRVLQLSMRNAEVAFVQIHTSAEQGRVRDEQISSQFGRLERPSEVRVSGGAPEPPTKKRDEQHRERSEDGLGHHRDDRAHFVAADRLR
jgi:hypothetical protein